LKHLFYGSSTRLPETLPAPGRKPLPARTWPDFRCRTLCPAAGDFAGTRQKTPSAWNLAGFSVPDTVSACRRLCRYPAENPFRLELGRIFGAGHCVRLPETLPAPCRKPLSPGTWPDFQCRTQCPAAGDFAGTRQKTPSTWNLAGFSVPDTVSGCLRLCRHTAENPFCLELGRIFSAGYSIRLPKTLPAPGKRPLPPGTWPDFQCRTQCSAAGGFAGTRQKTPSGWNLVGFSVPDTVAGYWRLCRHPAENPFYQKLDRIFSAGHSIRLLETLLAPGRKT